MSFVGRKFSCSLFTRHDSAKTQPLPNGFADISTSVVEKSVNKPHNQRANVLTLLHFQQNAHVSGARIKSVQTTVYE